MLRPKATIFLIALLVVITSCGKDPEQIAARNQLDELGIPYTRGEFYERVRQHDPVAVDLFLAAGMNPNPFLRAPLEAAASNNNTTIMKILFDRGAKANAKPWFSRTTALCSAAPQGHSEAVEMLFDRGATIEDCGCEGNLLFSPAKGGHTKTMRLLLEHGADPNVEHFYPETALLAGVHNIEIVRLLLENGANPNLGRRHGTPLGYAVNNPEILRILLNHGGDPDGPDDDDMTPLIRAAYYSRIESLLTLLDYGADANATSYTGTTALMKVAELGNAETTRILLEHGAEVDARNKYGATALTNARDWDHTDVIELLENAESIRKEGSLSKALRQEIASRKVGHAAASTKSAGPKKQRPNKKPYDFGACLGPRKKLGGMGIAFNTETFKDHAQKGDLQVARLFLDAGMDPDAYEHNSGTALMASVDKGQTAIAKLLLASGADPDKRPVFYYTPLYYAVKANDTEMVKVLLEYGANGDTEDLNGTTALMLAARAGNTEIVRMLLKADSVVKAFENVRWYGTSALFDAVTGKHTEVVKMLLAAGVDVNEYPDILAYGAKNVEILKMLLDSGADTNVRGQWSTPLLNAAMSGNAEAVKMLVEHGVDANVKDDEGRTDLMLAVDRDMDDAVKLLLNAGSDGNVKDDYGQTALMQAAWNGNAGMIRSLLEAGADADAKDRYGLTALSRARFRNHSEAIKLLEEATAESAPRETEEQRKILRFLLLNKVKVLATVDLGPNKELDGAEVRIRFEDRNGKNIDFNGITIPVAIRIRGHLRRAKKLISEGDMYRKSATISSPADVIHVSGENAGINKSNLKADGIIGSLGAVVLPPYSEAELVWSDADLDLDW